MNNTTSQLEKPFDLLCVEETEMLKSNLINAAQSSKLPLSVTKLVVTETFRELLSAIEQTLAKTSQDYYTELSQMAQKTDTIQPTEKTQQVIESQTNQTDMIQSTESIQQTEAPIS